MAPRKSRTTFNKVARERELRERRELKRERKQAARIAKAAGLDSPPDQVIGENGAAEPGSDSSLQHST
jgi:hypothetical protein